MRCNNCNAEISDNNPEFRSGGVGTGFCCRCVRSGLVLECQICRRYERIEILNSVNIYDEPGNLLQGVMVCSNCLDKSRVCENCGVWMSWLHNWERWDDYLCDSCVTVSGESEQMTCSDCGRRITSSNCYSTHQGFICSRCVRINKWKVCGRCGTMVKRKDFIMVGPGRKIEMCKRCYKRAISNGERFSKIELQKKAIPMPNHRGYLMQEDCDRLVGSEKIVGNKTKKIPSDRFIGLELESYGGNPFCAADMLSKEIGIVYDGSINGSSGKEFVSPPVSGTKIEEYVDHMTSSIIESGYRVNRSCGFHLHIDCNDIKNSGVKVSRLIQTYYAVEDILYGMLPPSRYVSSYSKPLKMFFKISDFDKVSKSKLEDIWYSKTPIFEDVKNIVQRYMHSIDGIGLRNMNGRNQKKEVWRIWYSDRKFRNIMKKYFATHHSIASRYLGLNLHSMYHRGTIEIRHHSGTLNKMKIMNWIKINLAIVEYAVNRFNKKDVISLSDTKYGIIKILRFGKMIGLNKTIVDYMVRRSKMFYAARMKNPNSPIDLNLEEDN